VPPHINKDSTPDSVFTLYFAAGFSLMVDETNRYYLQSLDTLDKRPSPVPDITESEMLLFLALIIQMGHDVRDDLNDYWTVNGQFLTPFYSEAMTRGRFLHIFRYLHFTNNQTAIVVNGPNYDRV
jgi:hypothetical protein